jgi:hypothetical protein
MDSTSNEGHVPKAKKKPCTPNTCPVCLETFATKRGANLHFIKCHPKEYDLEYDLRKHN